MPRPELKVADDPLAMMIFRLRTARQVSRAALSRQIGRNQTFIRDVEVGKSRQIGAQALAAIAEALGASVESLFQAAGLADPEPPALAPGAGLRLRAFRLASRWPQPVAFAGRLAVTPETLDAWEEGRAPIGMPALATLKTRADVPADWILFGDWQPFSAAMIQRLADHGGMPDGDPVANELREQLPDPTMPGSHTLHEKQLRQPPRYLGPHKG